MDSAGILVGLLLIYCVQSEAFHSNPFDVIRGCKQYANVVDYNGALEYFATDNLQHVGRTPGSKYFRFGIVGPTDGHIRFGGSPYPYGKDVIEIVLSGWVNTKSAGQRQFRTRPHAKEINVRLAEVETPNLLSPYRPTMFVLEVFNNGTVQVRKDGEGHPFLQFRDGNRYLPVDYMAFTKWGKIDLIYFYDCPLKEPLGGDDSIF
ncbi:uncharacterized protein LOC131263873 [Anopheles coustani]|uniref:uncharacterized protein LOC131263873 n=1 Tax=Anopheles coustani TaxID=139045 RepID=UPI00265B2F60|nr:uncharacterized protein LOC131263873 [Anopheles coustani]